MGHLKTVKTIVGGIEYFKDYLMPPGYQNMPIGTILKVREWKITHDFNNMIEKDKNMFRQNLLDGKTYFKTKGIYK